MRHVIVMLLIVGWYCSPGHGQVNLPEGFEVVEFLVSETSTGTPRINDCGQIVVKKDRREKGKIFLYDNGAIRTVTEAREGLVVDVPDINNPGTILWLRGLAGVPDSVSIVVLQDGRERVVVRRRGGIARINNLGHIAWDRFRRSHECGFLQSIMLYDGNSFTRIFRGRYPWTDQGAEINDRDQVTWGHADFCQNPWVGDIRLYSEGEIIVLPSEHLQVQGPTINNVPQVAWHGAGAIELWEDGETKELVETHGGLPRLNNLGDLYLARWDLDRGLWQPWLYRVSGDEPAFHRLVAGPFSASRGDINDWGEVVWWWWYKPQRGHFGGGVGFLRRVRTGDSEFDEDVDLIDYGALADCMSGPGRVDRLCDCRFLDIDRDGDVDLGDFALFQKGFTGEK